MRIFFILPVFIFLPCHADEHPNSPPTIRVLSHAEISAQGDNKGIYLAINKLKERLDDQIPKKSNPVIKLINYVDWSYGSNNGSLITIQQFAGRGINREGVCWLYKSEAGGYAEIIGDSYCEWRGKPILHHSTDKSWIVFPIKVKQGSNYPASNSSTIIGFDNKKNDICTFYKLPDSTADICPN